ncbi:ATP-dependent RNA helicase DHH1 [Hanseniaspora opuntiae]|jgi:ATP-dependent RNA helicase DDX6/DHH1|uniref:RNA helicase n=1 Tax=Hanseniaspora opuntiae TaxID=211096 RepID=A0A1E5RTS3_9ASCO|nr:ATP-dependent RNA helicase DHH1 [Hanseniaspora opuntiae]
MSQENNLEWKNQINIPNKDVRVQTDDITGFERQEFDQFPLNRELLMSIYEAGFEKASPIQQQSIPAIIEHHHCIARSKNGTGKTAAFVIPLLENIYKLHKENKNLKSSVNALVLVPTRELAMQTVQVIRTLSKHMQSIGVMLSCGGNSLRDDIYRLKSMDINIVVGTPGRLLDLTQRAVLDLSNCSMFMVDEADKMLNNDFRPVLENLLHMMNLQNIQICLFSATFPKSVKSFIDKYMADDLKEVNLMEGSDELTLKGITQFYCFVEEKQKLHCLNTLFSKLNINQCIIFCNSISRVELLTKKILELGVSCFYSHSKMPIEERNRVFHNFRKGEIRTLVCTDLLTRGIDISTVNVVINFDFPKSAETYLHRIGRSGRFGHLGLAINLVNWEDRFNLFKIEQVLNTEIKPIPNKIEDDLYVYNEEILQSIPKPFETRIEETQTYLNSKNQLVDDGYSKINSSVTNNIFVPPKNQQ